MTVFGDARFVREVQSKFVSVAVNQHHHRRRKDLERTLFAKLVHQTGEKVSGRNQGLYFFTPSAELLSFSNTISGGHAWKLLRKALEKYEPPEAMPAVLRGHEKAAPLWQLPKGSQAVLVTSRVLGGYDKAKKRNEEIHHASLGRDHFWLSKDDVASLAKGKFSKALAQRIVPLLNDNTRGEPGRWRVGNVKALDLSLRLGPGHGARCISKTRRANAGTRPPCSAMW